MMNCTVDFPFNRLRISVPVVGWLLVLVVALLLTGCRRSDDEREMLRPCFEVAPVKLEEGTTVQVRVLNASDVSVVTVPECVDARVSDKAVLSLTGLSVGEGRLRVNADGQALQCTVSVYRLGPGASAPEEPAEETSSQLGDACLRVKCLGREIRYDVPGSIFSMSDDGKELCAVSLLTGETIVFTCATSFNGDLRPEVCKISLNDRTLNLSEIEVMRKDASGLWLRLKAPDWIGWLVLPTDFLI